MKVWYYQWNGVIAMGNLYLGKSNSKIHINLTTIYISANLIPKKLTDVKINLYSTKIFIVYEHIIVKIIIVNRMNMNIIQGVSGNCNVIPKREKFYDVIIDNILHAIKALHVVLSNEN